MSLATFSFLVIFLFMIHEFDEIIFVRVWIRRRALQKNPGKKRDMWTQRVDKVYSSTAAIAAMIAEEFLLIGGLLMLAIFFNLPEFALGILLAYSLHLVGHIADAIRVRKWSPGSPTAAVTLPMIVIMTVVFTMQNSLNVGLILLSVLIAGAILLPNLLLLHKLAPKIQNFLDQVYIEKTKRKT